MKFAWTEKDKERFFKRAERQLKAAGIDFVQVDRSQIGVKEWDAEKQTAGTVYVWLTSYPYNHFSTSDAAKQPKVHRIRLAKMFFEDVASGKKSFELRKNDRGYKQGDILELAEYTNGEVTGRIIKAEVTYMLQEYAGLAEGYCIMAIKVSGNVITVTYTEQMLAVSGTGRGEIVLYNGTAVLRSATYYTKITPTVYKENGLISDNEFLDMAESIIAMNKQIDKAINATKSAEQAATDANTAAAAANSAAKAGNAAATAGNNAAKAANDAAAAANEAKANTVTATQNAQTATSEANTKAAAANNAAAAANKAAAACENMAKGINSMTDGTTGITYTIGINGGMVYLESV